MPLEERDESRLRTLYQSVGEELRDVEARIVGLAPEGYGELSQAVAYMLASGGKRVRPALVLLSARAVGEPSEATLDAAAACELFHMATLVVDDVLDGATVRRGRPSINARWNIETALLAAHYLYLSAASSAARVELNGARETFFKIVLDTAQEMFWGEVDDLEMADGRAADEDAYLTMVRGKTASLFSACCRIGAMTGSTTDSLHSMLAKYGEHLGMAFQIVDDTLDLVSVESKLGKNVGSDVRRGKMTLPIIHCMREATPDECDELRSVIGGDGRGLQKVRDVLHAHGSISYSLGKARQYADMARRGLAGLEESHAKRALLDMCRYVVERDY